VAFQYGPPPGYGYLPPAPVYGWGPPPGAYYAPQPRGYYGASYGFYGDNGYGYRPGRRCVRGYGYGPPGAFGYRPSGFWVPGR
jgi:hypothetical protein